MNKKIVQSPENGECTIIARDMQKAGLSFFASQCCYKTAQMGICLGCFPHNREFAYRIFRTTGNLPHPEKRAKI
jgi:hypothetical protein